MRNAAVILILTALFLAVPALAEFTAEVNNTDIKVETGKTAYAEIRIVSGAQENINTILNGRTWAGVLNPQLYMEPGQTEIVTIYFSPPYGTKVGTYKMDLTISSSNQTIIIPLFVRVENGEGAVIDSIDVTGELVPSGTVQIIFTVKNTGNVDLKDLTIQGDVTSPDGQKANIHKYIEFLIVGESTERKTYMDLPSDVVPGKYLIDVTLSRPGLEYQNAKKEFIVIAKPVLKQEVQEYSTLFGYGKRIDIENIGNAASGNVVVSNSISPFDAGFLRGDYPTELSGDKAVWVVSGLAPGKRVTLQFNIDYTPFVLFMLAVTLVSWFVLTRHSTIKFSKYIMQQNAVEEGTEYTIALEIKNRLGKVSDVQITDFVPSFFKVHDAAGIRHEKVKGEHGTKLKWNIDHLNNGDERVLMYKLTTVVGVHGSLSLPRSRAKFIFKGRNFMKKSNLPVMGQTTSFMPKLNIGRKHSKGGQMDVKKSSFFSSIRKKPAKKEAPSYAREGPLKMTGKVMKVPKERKPLLARLRDIQLRKKSPRDEFLEQFELDEE